MSSPLLSFYTYLWLREDGTPYYVGKGTIKRALRKGAPKGRVIIQEHPCEADAFAIEKFLISYYGRKDIGTGILRNRTDGGEGGATNTGKKFSEITKAKMSKSMLGKNKGKKRTASTKKAISDSLKGNKHALRGKSRTGQKHSPEVLEKIRTAAFKREAARRNNV